MLNADLHCHSTVSDGTLPPEEVARHAADGGVELWSLTDHDEIGGQARARAAAKALGMRYIDGVEISVTWAERTVHIVGLAIDPANADLIDGLARTRAGRQRRAEQMADGLAAVGIPGAYEGALRYVGNPDLISRTHFARYLVEIGKGDSVRDVFGHYLVEGRPGYVPHRWATLEDAVTWIRGAGGVAVIAHPGRYRYSALEFQALFDEFKALGGEGIEVVTGSHSPEQYRYYADVARRLDLLASRGSDFHGLTDGRASIGRLPALPEGLVPVWQRWV
ncbi:PHP domain-containing protein [Pandoraea thiooxydans]|uniref:Phosphoesterase n=1 Tax=Pandoraea thiooxydans TaxID=445709 RepID=A0A0G3ERV7_9BURK|nr:3',5'-nucleoside bisphosphate phosphatase [Pandoraea thiooxydans]AKJ67386.1 phosphatase [Pandoraea thiooxydans]APR94408.1 PHP domain-containing protein [Pandoraea thiooxydans]